MPKAESCSASSISHAEGVNCIAVFNSHAEGFNCVATQNSHAEGSYCTATNFSHVEGQYCYSSGTGSHVQGSFSTGSAPDCFVSGYYLNVPSYATGVNLFGQYGWASTGHGDSDYSFQMAYGSSPPGGGNSGICMILTSIGPGNTPSALMYGVQVFNSGADYAEYFEWADGNTGGEDR